ncbi:MAG TPA: SDR family oxidoreductase [Candidatus Dormibacteraeota bacterium]|nr:SDR family oxidoreductase [Candidatus Dormibacteraeota bacterium]
MSTAHRSTSRRAWVTGASVGIGAAFARRLARDGYDLSLVARSRRQLEQLADELHAAHGIRAEAVAADLTDAKELLEVEHALAHDGHLALLVNNAGFGTNGAFASLDVGREEDEIRLNVVALTRLTRAALPGLIRRDHGGVINVSSLAGLQPAPFNATYGATKAFVNSFTEALYEELRGTGVRVMALCPGFTRTEFQERAGIDTSGIPSLAWMSAEAVVDAAMAGYARGEAVCVPGFGNWAMSGVTAAMPRALVRRLLGVASARVLRHR